MERFHTYHSSIGIHARSSALAQWEKHLHLHLAMGLFRGLADDLMLEDWLVNHIFPAEARFVNPEFVRIGVELVYWEMIRGGTTTFIDMYFYPDVEAEVIERCELRGVIAPSAIEYASLHE